MQNDKQTTKIVWKSAQIKDKHFFKTKKEHQQKKSFE